MQGEEIEASEDQQQSFTEYRDPKGFLNEARPTFYSRSFSTNSRIERRLQKRWKNNELLRYRKRVVRAKPLSDLPVNFSFRRTVVTTDDSSSSHWQLTKREITTIEEEVYHYKCSKSHTHFKQDKAYKDKVASLKTVVNRLKQMCLSKPEVTQEKLPEEVMLLFSGIKL